MLTPWGTRTQSRKAAIPAYTPATRRANRNRTTPVRSPATAAGKRTDSAEEPNAFWKAPTMYLPTSGCSRFEPKSPPAYWSPAAR